MILYWVSIFDLAEPLMLVKIVGYHGLIDPVCLRSLGEPNLGMWIVAYASTHQYLNWYLAKI